MTAGMETAAATEIHVEGRIMRPFSVCFLSAGLR
jgi:hypothetical protein